MTSRCLCVPLSLPMSQKQEAPGGHCSRGKDRGANTANAPLNYPVHTVHGIVQARILEWVAISFSEKTLENPLEFKEIQPVSPQGNQPFEGLILKLKLQSFAT